MLNVLNRAQVNEKKERISSEKKEFSTRGMTIDHSGKNDDKFSA